MASARVLHRWAYDDSGTLVDVSGLDQKSRGGSYRCIVCGSKLIPKLGKVKAHHFAHAVDSACSGESYLHRLAKLMFVRGFESARQDGRSFNVSYVRPVSCDVAGFLCQYERVSVDLARIFDIVEVEVLYQGFVIDVLLRDSQSERVLAVEMAVTHQCEPEKVAKGFPILEFLIDSEEQCRDFAAHDAKIQSYMHWNWKIGTRRLPAYSCNDCPGVDLFVVYPSGKSILLRGYLGEKLPRPASYQCVMGVSNFSRVTAALRYLDGKTKAKAQGVWVRS